MLICSFKSPEYTWLDVFLKTGAFESATKARSAVDSGQVRVVNGEKLVTNDLSKDPADYCDNMFNSIAVKTGKRTGLVIYAMMNNQIWYDKGW